MYRIDETQHRLVEWTNGQHSERLAAQVLSEEGYAGIDPSHPYGGQDGGRDIVCTRDGHMWIGAVYFPRGQQSFTDIKKKLADDIEAAAKHDPHGIAFVTNQQVLLSERAALAEIVPAGMDFDLFHMERVATILDRPHMGQIREKFLHLPVGLPPLDIAIGILGTAHCFSGSDDFRDALIELEAKEIREYAEHSREPSPPISAVTALAQQHFGIEPPEPITDDEAERQVATMTSRVRTQWPRSERFIAERAFSAIGFSVTNTAESFLTNVELVLTFHGVQGYEKEYDTTHLVEKIMDPDYKPSDWQSRMADTSYLPRRFDNDPVQFENVGDDLRVTITLQQLRPQPAQWTSDPEEIVVLAPGTDPVAVTWYATAQQYPTALECGFDDEGTAPIQVPVTEVAAIEAFRQLSAGDE